MPNLLASTIKHPLLYISLSLSFFENLKLHKAMAASFNQRMLFPLVFIACVFCFSATPSFAELPQLENPAKPDGSLSFLVVGDWGRRGFYNQTLVAHQVRPLLVIIFFFPFLSFFFLFRNLKNSIIYNNI